jgi:SAM-dependent methyltransferase
VSDAKDRDSAKVAYEGIASVYDDFTAHHDYAQWLANFLPKLESHGLRGGRLLDVACGTGRSFLWMLEQGWEVTACDISPAMLAQARAKAGDRVSLSVADMRELPVLGEFELVWALGDVVNYLLSCEELEAALGAMRRNLAPGGLVMFDANTVRTYRTFFAERQVVERDGKKLIWEGQASPDAAPGGIYESRFRVEAGGEVSAAHVHRQRHFPESEILAAIKAARLTCLDVFGHGYEGIPEQPVDVRRHHKAVYIAGIDAAD